VGSENSPVEIRFDPQAFSGELPLFPLPEFVLLPGGLVPLHVFEPRYRDMVRDALEGERLIGMALLLEGQLVVDEVPEIEPMVCLGRIVLEREHPDGRFNLVLAGMHRARVLSEDRSRSYRLAKVELVADQYPQWWDDELAATRLVDFFEQLPAALVRQRDRLHQATLLLRRRAGNELPLGAVVDLLADGVVLEPNQRLELLREPKVGRRLSSLTDACSRAAIAIQGHAPRVSWRPRFSLN
jgi:Lon protease-like protein